MLSATLQSSGQPELQGRRGKRHGDAARVDMTRLKELTPEVLHKVLAELYVFQQVRRETALASHWVGFVIHPGCVVDDK